MSRRRRDADRVARALEALSAADARAAGPLPGADQVWRRAAVLEGVERRRARVRRAVRPLAWVDGTVLVLGAALAAWLAASRAEILQAWLLVSIPDAATAALALLAVAAATIGAALGSVRRG